jgi:prolyl oligopeptidase
LHSSEDGKWILAAVANGDGGQYAHYVMDPSGKWSQVTHFEDEVVGAVLGTPSDPALYLLSRHQAPRGKVLRVELSDPELSKAEAIVPQSSGSGTDDNSRASITGFVTTSSRLYVTDEVGGPSRVRIFDHHGKQLGILPAPPISAINQDHSRRTAQRFCNSGKLRQLRAGCWSRTSLALA